MSTLIVDKTAHKPVSNMEYQAEAVKLSKTRESALVTFPEKASTVANFMERERNVSAVTPASPTSLTDVSAASFGNRKILEVVIADDDREAVKNVLENPWKKIAALRITAQNGEVYAGTAWFISRTVLATAGHCVFLHDEGGWPQKIEVIPALDGTARFFKSYTATKFESSDGWVKQRNSDYDYGVIILDEQADERIGWFSFGAANDAVIKNTIANISGYPVDLDRGTKQYYHARKISRASFRRIVYDIDTYGGQSGSPVWMNFGENDRVAVGIHTNGNSNSNYGTRITDEVANNLKNWKNI